MMALHSKFHLPVSRGSIVIIRSENKENIHMADVFSIVNGIKPTKAERFSRFFFFTIVGLVSVPPQNYPFSPWYYWLQENEWYDVTIYSIGLTHVQSFVKICQLSSCLHRASMTIKHFIIQLMYNI